MMKTYLFALATFLTLVTSTLAYAGKDKVWSNEEIGAIPLEDGMDENGNPDEDAVLFVQKWQGIPIVMVMGGVKLTENYATCTPGLRGARPQSVVKGNLAGRMRGGSGGNPIDLTNCMIVRK
jgi:hypothetical protein